jgi:ribonuclease Z
MRPLMHPTLVSGRTGDPVLYIETLFERRAVLFDLGDVSNLPARKLQRAGAALWARDDLSRHRLFRPA